MSNIQFEPTDQAPQKIKVEPKQEKETSLKGTLVSVFLLGGFIVVTWVAVFALFLSRS